MTKPTRAQLTRIQTQQERAMLQAFNAIIADIREQAVLSEIVRALEVGNVDAVIRLMGIDEATWSPLADQIRESYRQGGITGASQLGRVPVEGGTTIARFDMRAPAAEAWVAAESSKRVVEIAEEQRRIVRNFLKINLMTGSGPRETALDLVGRVDPRSGKRVGGFIGLTENQAGWITNSRRDLDLLTASPDDIAAYFARMGQSVPDNYSPGRSYLARELRDKRFDGAVKRAIADGTPLPQTQIDAAVTQMQARAQRYRGEVIARTESINALREGQAQAISQALETAEIDPTEATKTWSDTGDGKTRPSHANVDPTPIPIDQPFIVGGYQMMHPGDSSMGAPAAETIQCRCTVTYSVDYLGRAARIEGFG